MLLPDEGTMDIETVKEIVAVFQSFTPDSCYFQYDLLATTFYNEGHGNGHLFYGPLQEVFDLYNSKEHVGSPTYWWNENKNWCLYTDPDMDFTLFGGSRNMIDKLKANASLECIEVDRDTRVDYRADMENHPL